MKATTFITPPHSGQARGSISYTRLMSIAQVWLARRRHGASEETCGPWGGGVGRPSPSAADDPAGESDAVAAAAACFRRMPRALFEYQP
jgi:hypothetical protein